MDLTNLVILENLSLRLRSQPRYLTKFVFSFIKEYKRWKQKKRDKNKQQDDDDGKAEVASKEKVS